MQARSLVLLALLFTLLIREGRHSYGGVGSSAAGTIPIGPLYTVASKRRKRMPPAPIICPVCGGANAHNAVFCANPACHKALGEFRYVLEELRSDLRWHEALAQRVVGWIGKPQFLGVYFLWFALWVAINTGVLAWVMRWDTPPFSLLGIILAMETIFITGFVLISQNRQADYANKRAELDYEVNIQTYRKIHEMESALAALMERLDRMEHPSGPQ